MSMNKSLYPVDWDAISHRIRFERAGGKCEQCGVAHGAYILRSIEDGARYIVYDAERDWYRDASGQWLDNPQLPEEFAVREKFTIVVLTVHHIGIDRDDGTPGSPHDKMDCREANLIALCQRCHLKADMPTHVANARETRLKKKQEALKERGQLSLF